MSGHIVQAGARGEAGMFWEQEGDARWRSRGSMVGRTRWRMRVAQAVMARRGDTGARVAEVVGHSDLPLD